VTYKTRLMVVLVAVLSLAGRVEPSSADEPSLSGAVPISPAMQEVLRKIDTDCPYDVPDLPLKEDAAYANTVHELAPFRHVEPFMRHFLVQLEYTGPGRSKPEPERIESVKLGFIGPIEATVSVATGGKSHGEELGTKMLQGAQLAIEHANAAGGYHKRQVPFELVVRNDNGLWGSSGNEIIDMAYRDKVWAILGTIDGANSHIAIRVALKIEIPMMNSGDTDPTLMETNIPWIVRCIGDDRQMAYLLVDTMYRKLDFKRVGIIRASNRFGRFGVREINDGSRRLGRPIVVEMAYSLGAEDVSLQLERLEQSGVDAVVHWGDAEDGARVLNQMRARGMTQPFFANDRCISDRFVEIAGENAEGVVCGSPWNPDRQCPRLDAFRAAFRAKFNEEPETYAAHAYDGTNLLMWAVQVAGLNRAKIRDALAHRTEPWPGVTGDIPFSAALDDAGEVYLAKRENGRWRYYSRDELEIPETMEGIPTTATE
jgi:branched-chain amino acid transport system substrate-binding protein